jgi:hypothetical protein
MKKPQMDANHRKSAPIVSMSKSDFAFIRCDLRPFAVNLLIAVFPLNAGAG